MKIFKPIICKKKYIDLVNTVIEQFLIEYYFNPIFEVVKPIYEYYNDTETNIIIEALKKNQIQYVDGKFYGKFNASLSKALIALGAKWNKRTKTFDIARSKLSMDIIGAIGSASLYSIALHKALNHILSTFDIESKLPTLAKWLQIPLDTVLEDLDEQAYNVFFKSQLPKPKPFGKRVKEFIKNITVSPKAEKVTLPKEDKTTEEPEEEKGKEDVKPKEEETPKDKGTEKPEQGKEPEEEKVTEETYQRAKLDDFKRNLLKKEFTENIELSIKNFTDKQTIKLRHMVEQNALYGLKNQSLVDAIQKEFKVTLNKAKFLARNETGIFTAKYHKAKALSLGYTKYVWTGVNDERERKMHKELNNLVFEFENPPIVNKKGDRLNPGEDYNCRCVARTLTERLETRVKPTTRSIKYALG